MAELPALAPWTPHPEISRPSRQLALRVPRWVAGAFLLGAELSQQASGHRSSLPPSQLGAFKNSSPPPPTEQARLWRQAGGPVQRGWPGAYAQDAHLGVGPVGDAAPAKQVTAGRGRRVPALLQAQGAQRGSGNCSLCVAPGRRGGTMGQN